MLPGRRADNGSIFVVQGPAPVGALMEGGIAVTPLGAIYVNGGAGFSPLDLFAQNEQGAWYDPSDLSTMFQDSAGTTPVTADGQPVGLILDKSKGPVLGSEVVAYPLSAVCGASFTVSGTSIIRNGSTGTAAIAPVGPSPLPATKTYLVTYTISGFSGDSWGIRVGGSAAYGPFSGNGSFTARILSGGSTTALTILPWGGGAGTATFNNISVKELPGNHASQATAAKRPLLAATGLAEWTNYDAVDDVLNTTFPLSLGSSCTVAKAVVGGSPAILTGQTIGTTWAESTDNAGVVIVNRALTSQETTDLTAWLLAKGATS